MQKNDFYMTLLILVLVLVIARCAYGMIGSSNSEEKYQVSVLVDNGTSERYISLRTGLEQAAQEFGVELNYISSGTLTSLEEEEILINKELDNGADGLIVQMVSSFNAEEYLENVAARASLVLIENEVYPENVYSSVLPDNYVMGQELGQQIVKDYGNALSELSIGVVTGKQSELAMQQRVRGLRSGLGSYGRRIVWSMDTQGDEMTQLLQEKMKKQRADILVALENDRTEQAVDFLTLENIDPEECVLYGIGCSEKNVYYVDQGKIRVLVVVNEYNMGYLSLEQLVKQISFRSNTPVQLNTNYLIIDRENMYEEENQKQLFPLVQ